MSPLPPLSRREFLRTTALAAGAAALAGQATAPAADAGFPTRVLGRTGFRASILTLGLGAAGDGEIAPDVVREIVRRALDAGVNVIDTAPNYGRIQAIAGPAIATDRDRIFLISKVEEQTRDGARRQIEQSRRDLQCDVLDAVLIHNVADFEFEHLVGPQGAFTALREARDAGHTRFLGISGHNRPGHFLPAIATGEVDLVLIPTNFVDRHLYHFEERVLPAATAQRCGVIGMKVLGGVEGWNYRRLHHARLGAEEYYGNAVRYALSLEGIATAAMGLCTLDELDTALAAARAVRPLEPDELEALLRTGEQLAPQWGHHYGPPE
jgi:uncharacterized protein